MEPTAALFELASVSLACRDQDTLLKTFVARVGAALSARTVLVWLLDADAESLVCQVRWSEPGERLNPINERVSEGLLVEIFESGEARRLGGREITSTDFSHLEDASRA